jgi:subtilisin-like proprotein convertase family protein
MPITIALALPLVLAAQGEDVKPLAAPALAAAPARRAPPSSPIAPRVYGAIPAGTVATTSTFTNSTLTPIPDVSTVTSSIVVAGAGTNVWDIDLAVAITHTYAADLDITLIAPSGKWVTVTTDNGAGNDDVFNGTLFDDSAPDTATDYPYVSGVAAPTLTIEGALDRFRGENPNGTWTLSITDDLAQDTGDLHSWSLHVTSLDLAVGNVATATFTKSPFAAIPNPGSAIDTMPVSIAGGTLCKLRLYTRILHPTNTELDVTLTSPNGTLITLSSDNGLGNDDGFANTWWDDTASLAANPLADDPASDHVFTSGIPAPSLVAESALAAVLGENPNGVWKLEVADDTGNIYTGTLERWDLEITTCAGAGKVYCTAKTNALGCLPAIQPVGGPSASATSGYLVRGTNVRNNKNGLLFYGVNGPASSAFQGGTLCVKAQIKRTPAVNSGGAPVPANDCSGVYVLDMNSFAAGALGGTPLPALSVPGTLVNCQWWGRDPGFLPPNNTTLTDGLEYTVGP